MKAPKVWIVTADGGSARFFHRSHGRLTELEELAMKAPPTPRERGRPARVHDRIGPSRHGVEPRKVAKDANEAAFLRNVAHAVNLAAEKELFDQFVLCAPPRPLGLLREELSEDAVRRMRMCLAKDLIREPIAALTQRIAEELP